MNVHHESHGVTLHHGDCREVLRTLPECSVDAVVTDPPYALGFMGKAWDSAIACQPDTWREVLRVVRPGGFLLSFGGTRTWHRMACALEDAGAEVRDTLCWLHGQGFPKSGACLKPAWEPVLLCRKHGELQPLNVDGCRIAAADGYTENAVTQGINTVRTSYAPALGRRTFAPAPAGRWPSNVCLDEEAAEMLDAQSGPLKSGDLKPYARAHTAVVDIHKSGLSTHERSGDTGGASRFFYVSKASRSERGESNTHPTVKPLPLMRWLVRLVTPAGGTVLDPFAGSGTTLLAAYAEGFRAVGVELEAAHCDIVTARFTEFTRQGDMFAATGAT